VLVIILIITLIKKTEDWYWTLLFIVPMGVIYRDKATELFDHTKKIFGESAWERSQRKLMRAGKLQKDTTIRISFAYLFRVKVDSKYFLVANSRTSKYQPVGGAYKFDKKEAIYLSKNIPAENDDCIPVNKVTRMDYRLLIENKNLKIFLKRFDKTKNRESIDNLSREFIEEIFESGILKKEKFGALSYRYCGRHITEISKSPFNHYEILLADIVEVDLTEKQEELFRDIMGENSDLYIFATPKEIISLGMNVGTQELKDNIANHTYKILTENDDELIKGIKYKFRYKSPIRVNL
jgi:hypothetical protein